MRLELRFGNDSQSIVLGREQATMTLAQILRSHNLPLNTRCGERDLCAGCLLELVSGSLIRVDGERLDALRATGEIRGCQFRTAGDDVVLRIPQQSRLGYAPKVLDEYRINVPAARNPIIDHGLGCAIDVGTTTVALQVFDLATGQVLGKASGFNKQMHFGDDVLTRINLCSTDPHMLTRLREAIICETINPLVAETGCVGISGFCIAGNTTMLHILAGEDPSSLGVAPFTPGFLEHEPFPAGRIGLDPPDAQVFLLPSIAAYIGADLTAGLFASGLLYEEGPSLLVDVGTNGEILLNNYGAISGCATAAGPAFEGSGLTCGIRAGEGAISRVEMKNSPFEIQWESIGKKGRPAGICGSAYVDFLAEGRRVGLLSPTGRFQDVEGSAEHTTETEYGRAIRLAFGQGKRPILVSEADVARLLQAKGAIAAGILVLLKRHDLRPSDVRRLLLAGGFGMHLDLENAIQCALLPGFRTDQIELVGNTSLAGAVLSLLDRSILAELSRARQDVEVVELNLDPEFEDTYLDQLQLPQGL